MRVAPWRLFVSEIYCQAQKVAPLSPDNRVIVSQQPDADAERATKAGAEAVRDEQRPVTVQQAFMGELVGTQGGIKTAAEMAANPPAFRGQTHGKVNAKHGVHMPPKAPAAYTCGDCLDLERRIRIAFKSMGFEF